MKITNKETNKVREVSTSQIKSDLVKELVSLDYNDADAAAFADLVSPHVLGRGMTYERMGILSEEKYQSIIMEVLIQHGINIIPLNDDDYAKMYHNLISSPKTSNISPGNGSDVSLKTPPVSNPEVKTQDYSVFESDGFEMDVLVEEADTVEDQFTPIPINEETSLAQKIVLVYSKPGDNVNSVKHVLKDKGILFEEISSSDPEFKFMVKKYDIKKSPTVVVETGDNIKLLLGAQEVSKEL